jgi:urease beta subunit
MDEINPENLGIFASLRKALDEQEPDLRLTKNIEQNGGDGGIQVGGDFHLHVSNDDDDGFRLHKRRGI